jgi:hypothetical protein
MNHAFRAPRTSSRRYTSRNLLSSVGIAALSALLAGSSLFAGCSSGGGDGGAQPKGGSSANAAGSDGNGSSLGGDDDGSGDGGAMTGTSGSQNSAGTATGGVNGNGGGVNGNGGAATGDGGDGATSGGAGEEPGPGGVGLGAADGITGTFEGVVHTHTFNAVHVPQQTETVVIGANSAMYPLWDAWGLRFLPKLGVQACTGDTGTDDTFITFGSQSNYLLAGTTAKGACSINVTSITPKLEGTFTATLKTGHGDVEVTDGAFRVPN